MRRETSGIHHLAIRVTDLGRAKQFYCETLGFPAVMEPEGVVILDMGGTYVGIRDRDEQTPTGDRFSPFRVGLDHLAIHVPDPSALDRLREQLDAAGVPNNGIEEDPVLGGQYISFYDPDGIAWELFSPSQ